MICTMSLSKNARCLLCVVAALIFLVAFGASILAIWVGGKYKPLSADQACPTLNLASLPANQVVFKKNVYEPAGVCAISVHEFHLYVNAAVGQPGTGAIPLQQQARNS